MSETTGRPRQFNIAQLLILTTLIALMLAAVLHFDWFYFPSVMWDYYEASPFRRKMFITLAVALLPTFIMGVLVWLVVRMPYLIANHQQLQKRRRDRREALQRELMAQESEAPKSPLD